MKISKDYPLSQQLDWIFSYMGTKWDNAVPMVFDDEQTKLFAAHVFNPGTGSNSGKWLIDWKWLGIDSKQAPVEWKERAKRIDKSDRPRARAIKPFPELFDELELGWYDTTKTDHQNIDTIYKERGKIICRSSVAAMRKNLKCVKTIKSCVPGEDFSKQIKPAQDMINKMPMQARVMLQDWLYRANNNKLSKVLEFKNIPEPVLNRAKRIVSMLETKAYADGLTATHQDIAEFCMAGLTPAYFEPVFDRQGDIKYLEPVNYLKMADLLDSEITGDTQITLAAYSAIPLARIAQVEAAKIRMGEHLLVNTSLNVRRVNGQHTLTKDILVHSVKENWQSHNEVWKEWLCNPNNFKTYHLYRTTVRKTWKFNIPAICISILVDTGFFLNPLAIEMVLAKKPSLIAGSPLVEPDSIVRIINAN